MDEIEEVNQRARMIDRSDRESDERLKEKSRFRQRIKQLEADNEKLSEQYNQLHIDFVATKRQLEEDNAQKILAITALERIRDDFKADNKRLKEEARSWRSVAERLEREKQALSGGKDS